MGKTSIEWTDESSNPLRYRTPDGRTVWACVKVSPGCANCYSAGLSERFTQRSAGPYNLKVMQGLTPYLDEKEMRRLLTSKALSGKRVFMCDMTDLFGEWVPDEMIAAVFGVMAARPDVTFQVLTKHAERMARWFNGFKMDARMHLNWCVNSASAHMEKPPLGWGVNHTPHARAMPWPLSNVQIGVSVEDRKHGLPRLDELRKVPAAVRMVSFEPLLEDLGEINLDGIGWAIVGGESGPGARPFALEWAQSIADQCAAAGTAYFFKQGGAHLLDDGRRLMLADRKGGDVTDLARLFPDLAAAGAFRREWPAVRS